MGRLCTALVVFLVLSSPLVSTAQIVGVTIGPAPNPIPATPETLASVDSLISEMDSRWRALDEACSPNAPFSKMYLIMTQYVRDHVASNYFADNDEMGKFMVHFAGYYFRAIDGSAVSRPWREAFNWGQSGLNSVIQDLFLGMNAHIMYDLALTVADRGWTSIQAKIDYNRINDVLSQAANPILQAMGQYYDPLLAWKGAALTVPLFLQYLFLWREAAHTNGVLIAADPIGAAKLLTESAAVTNAQLFKLPSGTDQAARLAFCQSN